MLPPPTTTAMSTPSSRASTISRATNSATFPSIGLPSWPANASPDSFSRMRG